VVCTAQDECHEAGTCDPTTGTCSNPIMAGGTKCTGGTCANGKCVSGVVLGKENHCGCATGTEGGAMAAWSLALLGFAGLRRRRG